MRAVSVPAFGYAGVVAALIFAAAAEAQAPSSAAAGPAPPQAAAEQAAVEERIAQLQSQLGITSAQLPLWGLYASLSGTQKQTADALFREQAAAAARPRSRR